MRRAASNLAIIIQLAALAVLLVGYTGRYSATLTHYRPGGVIRHFTAELDSGRVALWWGGTPSRGLPASFLQANPPGLRLRPAASVHLPGGRDVRRAIWEFDAHTLVSPAASSPGWVFLLAFPIWCAAVPCAAFPAAAWLRRRRAIARRAEGFAVIGNAPSTPQATSP